MLLKQKLLLRQHQLQRHLNQKTRLHNKLLMMHQLNTPRFLQITIMIWALMQLSGLDQVHHHKSLMVTLQPWQLQGQDSTHHSTQEVTIPLQLNHTTLNKKLQNTLLLPLQLSHQLLLPKHNIL